MYNYMYTPHLNTGNTKSTEKIVYHISTIKYMKEISVYINNFMQNTQRL